MRFSIKAFNRELAPHGIELVKGAGYFYFADLDGAGDGCVRLKSASVAVFAFKDLSPAQWRAEAVHILGQIAQVRIDDAANPPDARDADGIVRLKIKPNRSI